MSAVTSSLQSGVYFIRNIGTETVMELPGGSPANGVQITGHVQRTLNDPLVASQPWIVSRVGSDNTYTIENANSRSFMSLSSTSPADNTPIVGHQVTGNSDQLWTITRSTNPDLLAFVVSNKGAGTFADLFGDDNANGALVNGFAGVGSTTRNMAQLWNFVRA